MRFICRTNEHEFFCREVSRLEMISKFNVMLMDHSAHWIKFLKKHNSDFPTCRVWGLKLPRVLVVSFHHLFFLVFSRRRLLCSGEHWSERAYFPLICQIDENWSNLRSPFSQTCFVHCYCTCLVTTVRDHGQWKPQIKTCTDENDWGTLKINQGSTCK